MSQRHDAVVDSAVPISDIGDASGVVEIAVGNVAVAVIIFVICVSLVVTVLKVISHYLGLL